MTSSVDKDDCAVLELREEVAILYIEYRYIPYRILRGTSPSVSRRGVYGPIYPNRSIEATIQERLSKFLIVTRSGKFESFRKKITKFVSVS
jgi:hypothetical protein